MKIPRSLSLVALFAASVPALAQSPAPAPSPASPAAPVAAQAMPDRTQAYYHFQLGHMYEEMVAETGRTDYAEKALAEYKLAVAADPSSTYLSSALAELYARTGNIREAVVMAQDVVSKDPNNLDARRLLGRIYLRSIGDLQGSNVRDAEAVAQMAIEQYENIVRLDPKSEEDRLVLGRLYRLNNDTAKAEEQYREAVKQQPSSDDAVTTLALLYNEENDSNRALDVLNAVPETSRTPRIDAVLGFTYEQKKDYKHAIEAYSRAVAGDRDNLDALRGLAQNEFNDNQFDRALEHYKTISEADPQDGQTLLRIAEIQRHNGDFDKALETLSKAQQVAPDSMEIQYTRAVVDEALGNFEEAQKLLDELLTATRKSNGVYSPAERNNRAIFLERLGSVYRDENKTDLAVETFRKMIPLGDDSASRAYQQIIESYRDAKNWPAATTAAREAVAKMPKDRTLQMMLAGQEADSGDANSALARVRSMLTGNAAEDREVWVTLAQMSSRLHRYSDAEKALGEALKLSNKPEERDYVNFIAGSVYERQKKFDEAESYFRKVLASDPKNASALNYLGYMLADRGTRLDEALTLIRRAVALDPQNGAYLDSLGWCHYKMGKYDLAETTLRKAIDRIDNDPTVHEHLGDVYQKTNRLKQAVSQWERSLEEWKKTIPAEVEPNDVAKVQKKLDGARVKLAKQQESASK